MPSIGIIGAGVSGLTCGVLFAERGHKVSIFAEKTGQTTTSGAAAALWFPYDAEPAEKVIPWALATFEMLVELTRNVRTGVSMIELRQFSRTNQVQIPEWATSLGAKFLEARLLPDAFQSGFSLRVPLMDTTTYLDHLADRFVAAGGELHEDRRLERLEDVDAKFDVVLNCAGIGAQHLTGDADLEPHRGQVAIVPVIDQVPCAIVCDDPPLTYVIPRKNDCVWGGTNEISNNLDIDSTLTSAIISECSRLLKIEPPPILNQRVGLRPFRKSGVRLESGRLADGRIVVHNYGHGGSGFTLSWGCADEVFRLSTRQA